MLTAKPDQNIVIVIYFKELFHSKYTLKFCDDIPLILYDRFFTIQIMVDLRIDVILGN